MFKYCFSIDRRSLLLSIFILFHHHSRKYGYTLRSSFHTTYFGSLSHHQAFDFTFTCFRLLAFLNWRFHTHKVMLKYNIDRCCSLVYSVNGTAM
jgi:hypothetical protein